MNFLINDIIIPKIFHFDPKEIHIPIWEEFISFQKRFFKVYWIKKIFSSQNNIDFINESSRYSKELKMDIKLNSLNNRI